MNTSAVHIIDKRSPDSSPGKGSWALVAVLAMGFIAASGGNARAETARVNTVEDGVIKHLAGGALGYGAMATDGWEQRLALVALGIAGMHLDSALLGARRAERPRASRSLGYRIGLPLAGAAFGNLVARNSPSVELSPGAGPMIGSLVGSLAGHVLDRSSNCNPARRDENRSPDWTPTITVMPGVISVGISGRF